MKFNSYGITLFGIFLASTLSWSQLTPAEANAAVMSGDYSVKPDIVYLTANNYQNKLDLYQASGEQPHPTLIYIHGGGWVEGRKEEDVLETIPFLEKGWSVVNVEYRLAGVSLAPAAVEDCRCALRWVIEHAKDYKFDPNRIVLMGHSAGGHLSLITGMLSPFGWTRPRIAGDKELRVAAIVVRRRSGAYRSSTPADLGNRMYGGQLTHIPLRVNSAGMIPLDLCDVDHVASGTIASYLAITPGDPRLPDRNWYGFTLLSGPYWFAYFLLL